MNAFSDWADANQRHLVAALEGVRLLLARPGDGGGAPVAEVSLSETDSQHRGPFALETLEALFGLSPFERDILLLCAGMEMDARFAPLVAAAQGAARVATFGLALGILPGAHWSAITPEGPLRAWRLVELSGSGVTGAALRIDERVLHFLSGINQIDERLQGIVELLPAGMLTIGSHQAVGTRVAGELVRPDRARAAQITGADGDTRIGVAAAACTELGASVLRLRAPDLPGGAVERLALARLVAREALLHRAVVVLDASADPDGPRIAAFADSLSAPLVVCAAEPLAALSGKAAVFEVPAATRDERLALWQEALGSAAAGLNGALAGVCAQFDLGAAAIREVAARVTAAGEQAGVALWEECRLAARPRMEGLAQRIDAISGWDDLVLPDQQVRVLRDIAVQVRQRHRVYEDWGFAARSARGLGISALFTGASGTGKTMAAEVLARELCLDLYRIDLASIVSKYIGETEKNLKRLFDAAEGSGAILLFDEADALFGKRSEVKDSHDRYANIEVSYLLQRMESYRGLAILTTNMKNALDPAFLRRIRFIVQFPFPDTEHRAAIWRGILPARTPRTALDFERLAQLNIAGGHIRNIALAGAFLAADRGEQVAMSHLAEAARAEYAKLERPLTDAEARGWQ